jgi:hypothetical protein
VVRLDRILAGAFRAALRAGLAGAILGLLAPEGALGALGLSRGAALYGSLTVAGVAAGALAALRAFLAARRGWQTPSRG